MPSVHNSGEAEVFYDDGGFVVSGERISLFRATGHYSAVEEIPIGSITETKIESRRNYGEAAISACLSLLVASTLFWGEQSKATIAAIVSLVLAVIAIVSAIRVKPVYHLVVQWNGAAKVVAFNRDRDAIIVIRDAIEKARAARKRQP